MEKLTTFQIAVMDQFILVDWQVPGSRRYWSMQEDDTKTTQFGKERVKEVAQELQERMNEYPYWRLPQIQLERHVSGKNVAVSGERDEVVVYLDSLITVRYSGETIKLVASQP